MATSGTASFNYTRDQIIRAALRKCGAIASGETPGSQMVTDAAEALNAMVKEWDALGIHVWTQSEAILFTQPNQIQYALGPGSTDHAANSTSYLATTLAVSAAASVTSLTLTSAAGILSGDNIGITLDAGNIFWTTVNGTPAGNVVTITSGLTGSASAANPVYDYTTNVIRPLRIPAARRLYLPSAIETPMIPMSRLDYEALPNKTTNGTPTQFFYTPLLTTGLFYLWPAPVDATSAIRFTWYRPIQDFNSASDNPDLPQEWISTLVFNLAVEIAPEYDLPPQRYMILKGAAQEKLERVTGWDKEPESIYFGMAYDPQSR